MMINKRKSLGWFLVSSSITTILSVIGVAFGYHGLMMSIFAFFITLAIAAALGYGLQLLFE